ncbi:unnamed protein product [Penicillium pancosmium]
MTFGRPCTIPQSYVEKLNMPSPNMHVLSSAPEAENKDYSDGLFFTAAIKLSSILHNVLDSCYGQNLGFDAPESIASSISCLLDGQNQLNEWRLQLLPSLGFRIWDSPMSAEDVEKMNRDYIIYHRFNIVLSVRYNNLRILLHRRRLESFVEGFWVDEAITTHDKRLMKQMDLGSVESCVESAISIISTVHCIMMSGGWRRELLGAWNFSLYYTFNAALVIFVSLIVGSKERDNNPALWSVVCHSRPYMDMAVEAIRRLDSGNRVVERCGEYLSQLSFILGSMNLDVSDFNNWANLNLSAEFPAEIFNSQETESLGSLDWGEFMVGQDLDFLGRLFNQPQNGVDGVLQ